MVNDADLPKRVATTTGAVLATLSTALSGGAGHGAQTYRTIGLEPSKRYDVEEVRYVNGGDTVPIVLKPIEASTQTAKRIEAGEIMDLADFIVSTTDRDELLAVVSDHPDVLVALRSSLDWVDGHGLSETVQIEADRGNDGPLIEVRVDSGDDMDYWRSLSAEFRAWWISHYGIDMLYYLNVTIH